MTFLISDEELIFGNRDVKLPRGDVFVRQRKFVMGALFWLNNRWIDIIKFRSQPLHPILINLAGSSCRPLFDS